MLLLNFFGAIIVGFLCLYYSFALHLCIDRSVYKQTHKHLLMKQRYTENENIKRPYIKPDLERIVIDHSITLVMMSGASPTDPPPNDDDDPGGGMW